MVSPREKYRLPLRGMALVIVLVVPALMTWAAGVGSRPMVWGLTAIMAGAMALAVWVG